MAEHRQSKTPRDVLKVIFRRFWLFLIGWLVFAIIALFAQQAFREKIYTGEATFEARRETALEGTRGSQSRSFEALMQGVSQELTHTQTIEAVINSLGLANHLPQTPTGQLTDRGKRMKLELIREIQDNLQISMTITRSEVGWVTVQFSHENPVWAEAIPNSLVNIYTNMTGEKIKDRLAKHKVFLEQRRVEAAKLCAELQDRRDAFERAQPSQYLQDRHLTKQMKIDLEEQIGNLMRNKQATERDLEDLKDLIAQVRGLTTQPDKVVRGPNPERKELEQKLEKQIQLREFLKNQGYKDAHPKLTQAEKNIQQYREQIENTPKTIVLQSEYLSGADRAETIAKMQRMKREYEDELERATSKLGLLRDEMTVLTDVLANFGPYRQEHDAIIQELDAAESKLANWEQNLTQVEIELGAELAEKRTRLDIAERAQKQYKPASPGLMSMIGFAVAGGLGFAGLLIFLCMAVDHTVNGPEQAESAFGIPVHGIIGEIATPGKKQMRVFGKYILLPLICLILLLVLGFAGLMSKYWLEDEQQYRQMKGDPIGFVVNKIESTVSTSGRR
ncbi:MAG: GumC family protein [Phycisphaerae bacterium]